MLEGIGHVPQMEAPWAVGKMIDRFVDEVEARRLRENASASATSAKGERAVVVTPRGSPAKRLREPCPDEAT